LDRNRAAKLREFQDKKKKAFEKTPAEGKNNENWRFFGRLGTSVVVFGPGRLVLGQVGMAVRRVGGVFLGLSIGQFIVGLCAGSMSYQWRA
jgi:hypothetical protein